MASRRYKRLPSGHKEQLGPELVVDGSFDTACGVNWLCRAGWTISGGKAVATATFLVLGQNCLTIGTRYKIIYTIEDYSGGIVQLQCGNASAGIVRSANGTYTEILICAGSTELRFDGIAAFTGKIDNVSVKEVLIEEVDEILSISAQSGSIPSEDRWGNTLTPTNMAVYKFS